VGTLPHFLDDTPPSIAVGWWGTELELAAPQGISDVQVAIVSSGSVFGQSIILVHAHVLSKVIVLGEIFSASRIRAFVRCSSGLITCPSKAKKWAR
jgi:hypothetical protein